MTQNKDSKTREVDRSPLGQATPVSFLYMTYGQLRDGCQSRDGRNAGEKALVDHRRSWNKESRWDGAAWKPSRELGSLPILRAMVRAWPRQRRNAQPSDPQPGGSYDTRRPWHFAIACSRVQRLCRQLSSEQVSYRAFPHRCENLLTPLFLLSKSNPLRWASIWFWVETQGHWHL